MANPYYTARKSDATQISAEYEENIDTVGYNMSQASHELDFVASKLKGEAKTVFKDFAKRLRDLLDDYNNAVNTIEYLED